MSNETVNVDSKTTSENNDNPNVGQSDAPKFHLAKLDTGQRTLLILALLVIGVGGLVAYKQFYHPQPQVKTVTVQKQVAVRRSKDPGFMSRGLTGKAVDVNTGKIVKAAKIFSPDDKVVYLEVDLVNAPKDTVIDIIRYKNGRYVDHGELKLAKDNVENVLFNWAMSNILTSRLAGNWKIATYTDGILAKRLLYTVANNKVSQVDSEKEVSSSDPDYQLTTALFTATQPQ